MQHRRIIGIILMLFLMGTLEVWAAPATAQETRAELHKAALQQVYDDVLSAGKLELLDTVYAPDYVNHGYGDDLTLAAYKATIQAWREAMPDFQVTIEVLIANDEWAASRVVFGGTFKNPLVMGDQTLKPTDKPVKWALNNLHRFNKDGQIVEEFMAFDWLDLMTQLGESPLPPLIAPFVPKRELTAAVMDKDVAGGDADVQTAAFRHIIDDAINNGDLDAIDTYMAEDYRTYEPFGSFTRQQFRDVIQGFRTTVPDLHVTIDALVTEGDWLAARLVYVGTFSKDVSNGVITLKATHKPIRFIINVFVRFDAKNVPVMDFKEYNRLGWLQQLGILPGAAP